MRPRPPNPGAAPGVARPGHAGHVWHVRHVAQQGNPITGQVKMGSTKPELATLSRIKGDLGMTPAAMDRLRLECRRRRSRCTATVVTRLKIVVSPVRVWVSPSATAPPTAGPLRFGASARHTVGAPTAPGVRASTSRAMREPMHHAAHQQAPRIAHRTDHPGAPGAEGLHRQALDGEPRGGSDLERTLALLAVDPTRCADRAASPASAR